MKEIERQWKTCNEMIWLDIYFLCTKVQRLWVKFVTLTRLENLVWLSAVVQGWGSPLNIVFFYNGVSNNGSYPIVVSINSWGVGEVAWQFGERKLAWWGLEARRRRWLATDFARDIAVTKGIITEIRICIGGGLLILVNVILGYWSGLPLTFLSTELFRVNIAIGTGPLLPLPEYNLP